MMPQVRPAAWHLHMTHNTHKQTFISVFELGSRPDFGRSSVVAHIAYAKGMQGPASCSGCDRWHPGDSWSSHVSVDVDPGHPPARPRSMLLHRDFNIYLDLCLGQSVGLHDWFRSHSLRPAALQPAACSFQYQLPSLQQHRTALQEARAKASFEEQTQLE